MNTIYLCVLKSNIRTDEYTRKFVLFIDEKIKNKYQYHLVFKKRFELLSSYIEQYKNEHIIILWDKDIIKEEFQIVENSDKNVDNVIVFEKETDIFYNVDKEDITENFAIFNNMKVLYLNESNNAKKDFEIIFKNYKFEGL